VTTAAYIQELLGHVADDHRLSLTQMRLLGILRDREPGMRELARYLNLEKSSVSGLVDRAQQRGLVQRRPGTKDGRAVHVSLTPAGRAIAEQILRDLAQPLTELLRPLARRQRDQMTALLRSLLDER
jgi:DNA-binding MarR family transcriptional regulator